MGEQGRNSDIAAFVAGDHRIFFPALVFLTSLEKHNPGRFDRYICFNEADLTPEMAASLDRYGIRFVNSRGVEGSDSILAMRRLKGAHRWGIEVFMNWLLPEHFGRLGYRYSMKCDYDLLCVAPYATLNKVLPAKRVWSAMWNKVGTSHLNPAAAEKASALLGTSVEHPSSVNVGFMLINNARYVETDFLNRFQALYELIAVEAPEVRLPEQAAAAIVGHRTPDGGIGRLPKAYNQRQKYHPRHAGGRALSYNIHYITKYKPWRPLGMEQVSKFCFEHNHAMIPFYRNAWLEHAATIDGFEAFTDERPYDAMQLAALGSVVMWWMREAGKAGRPSTIAAGRADAPAHAPAAESEDEDDE